MEHKAKYRPSCELLCSFIQHVHQLYLLVSPSWWAYAKELQGPMVGCFRPHMTSLMVIAFVVRGYWIFSDHFGFVDRHSVTYLWLICDQDRMHGWISRWTLFIWSIRQIDQFCWTQLGRCLVFLVIFRFKEEGILLKLEGIKETWSLLSQTEKREINKFRPEFVS